MYRAMISAIPQIYMNLFTHMTTFGVLESIHSFIRDADIILCCVAFKTMYHLCQLKIILGKFWQQFIFLDCFAGVQLYLSIRCQKWEVRVSALGTLFIAYDRTTPDS